jgi:hypothetical protein
MIVIGTAARRTVVVATGIDGFGGGAFLPVHAGAARIAEAIRSGAAYPT